MTLYDIKKELTHPYADIRTGYTEPAVNDLFVWLTGETDSTLQEGTIVSARAFKHSDRSVICRLESGLIGYIATENISDESNAQEASTIPIGMTVHARVLEVDKEKFSCRLSCRGSDLDPVNWDYKKCNAWRELNPYLQLDPDVERKAKELPVNGMFVITYTFSHFLWWVVVNLYPLSLWLHLVVILVVFSLSSQI